MIIKLDQKLLTDMPDLKLGINYYTKITVAESPQMLKGRLQLFQEQLFFELEDKAFSEYSGIQEWRNVWKTFGADPNRYRPSVEALMRRIKKQNYIQPFHSAVDLNNFFSLQYEIPVGIYDFDKTVGNIHATVGAEDEGYEGLNGRFNSLSGIVLLKDDYSPFGSPFVDSIRTSVTQETTAALQVFFIRPSMDAEEALELTTSCANMFTSISGGDSQSYVIHSDAPSVTIDK
ncbi:phenylalanine--tRNA ligase beta subunit-related protein [Sporosarcina sp. 179-K 3D1 HS]|uniref:B3/B4 domain-containing protein n=1 Tax=Sporosarcina sp. 179-K 3D1 HS TaxID=3232169 RepID=UPI0039A120B5